MVRIEPTTDKQDAPSPESLLVTLCRRGGSAELDRTDLDVLSRDTFRQHLTDLATSHGVQGLVLRATEQAPGWTGLPEAIRASLSASLRQLRQQAAIWDVERDRLLSLLAREGLVPILLKGAALRDFAYEEPAERWMGDLDLLFRPDELDAAVEVLSAAGYHSPYAQEAMAIYRAHHFHFHLEHPRGFIVEVHWGLQRPRASYSIDPEGFRSGSAEREGPLGRMLRVPSSEDMVLHLTGQSHDDAIDRLVRLADLDRVIARAPSFEWGRLRSAARDAGLRTALAVSLRLAQLLLRTPVPVGFIDSLRVPSPTRLHLACLRPVPFLLDQRARKRVVAGAAFRFWATDGTSRLRRVRNMLREPPDPLSSVWDDVPREPPLLKFAAFQGLVYLEALRAALTPPGVERVRFWRGSPRGSLPGA